MKSRDFTTAAGRTIAFSELALGCAPMGNLYRARTEAEAEATLEAAWDAGIRYFDTAPLYGLGLSETRLNRFFRGKPRDAFVVSTKVGRLLRPCAPDQRSGIGHFFETPSRREEFAYDHDGVLRSHEASLERLGLDRIDILLVHDIDLFNHGTVAARDAHIDTLMAGGHRALSDLRDQGAISAFGAGVNEWQTCAELARRGDFDLFLMAGAYSLLRQEALADFMPDCARRGIGLILGGVFNSGILATGAVPGARFDYQPAPPEIMARTARIAAICADHAVALPDAALAFVMRAPAVAAVLTGAGSAAEVAQATAGLGRRIPAALWRDLAAAGLIAAAAIPKEEI